MNRDGVQDQLTLPPVDFRAVCLVRAIVKDEDGLVREYESKDREIELDEEKSLRDGSARWILIFESSPCRPTRSVGLCGRTELSRCTPRSAARLAEPRLRSKTCCRKLAAGNQKPRRTAAPRLCETQQLKERRHRPTPSSQLKRSKRRF